VALPDRGQPVGLVFLGVLLAADPEEAEVEQADRAREHSLADEPAPLQVALQPPAHAGQLGGELEHHLELLAITMLAPAVVVAILLAPGIVEPRRLDVPVRERAYPNVLPRRREDELVDPLEGLRVRDPLGRLLVDVGEAAATAHPADSEPGAVCAFQSRHGGRGIPGRGPVDA
jgi:hypothetical protein